MGVPGSNFRLIFNVDGEKQINDSLGIAAHAIKDWRPAFDKIHDDFTNRVMPSWFESSGDSKWPDYSNEPKWDYIKRRALGLYKTAEIPILRWAKVSTRKPQSGERLYPSLVDQNHPDHIYRTTGQSFTFGTSVPYAIRHQRGQGMQRFDHIPLPQRKIIDIGRRVSEDWAKILQAHFMSAVGKAGRVAGRGAAGRQSPTFKSYKKGS